MQVAVSDEQLVSEAKSGSREAFDELVSRHQERIYALAWRTLGSREDAADVQQETFVRAWLNLRSFREQCSLSTWLHRIAVNLCLDRRRTAARRGQCVEFDEAIMSNVDRPDSIEVSVAVREVLDRMPPDYRALLVLREVEGRSVEEVAQVMDRRVPSVRTQLYRARKLFRDLLRGHMGEDAE